MTRVSRWEAASSQEHLQERLRSQNQQDWVTDGCQHDG